MNRLEIQDFELKDYFHPKNDGCYLAKGVIIVDGNSVSVGFDADREAEQYSEVVGNKIYFNPNFDDKVLKAKLEAEKKSLFIIGNQQLFDEDELDEAKKSIEIELDSCHPVVPSQKWKTMTPEDVEKVSKCLSHDDFFRIFDRYDLTPQNMKITSVHNDADEVQIYALTEKIGEIEEEYVFYLPLEALSDFATHDDFEQSSFFDKMIDAHFSDSPRIYDEKQIMRDVTNLALLHQKGSDIVGENIPMPID